ncbi:hypothetical protein ACLB1O_21195 [Escherichia coli]
MARRWLPFWRRRWVLATAQALLARLETSVAIWFLLLVVYHVIRRLDV